MVLPISLKVKLTGCEIRPKVPIGELANPSMNPEMPLTLSL
jgi:hypothetical protein